MTKSTTAAWLIVEDESLVAMSIEDALAELGLGVVGPFSRVAKALPSAREAALAGALLDVNVAGEPVYPVAEILAGRGVPIVFLTGYGSAGLRADFRDRPTITKPFTPEQIAAAVRRATPGSS